MAGKSRASTGKDRSAADEGVAKAEAKPNDLREAIGKRPDEGDRALTSTLYKVIKTSAQHLAPRIWFGFPTVALDGPEQGCVATVGNNEQRSSTTGWTSSV